MRNEPLSTFSKRVEDCAAEVLVSYWDHPIETTIEIRDQIIIEVCAKHDISISLMRKIITERPISKPVKWCVDRCKTMAKNN